MRIGFIREKNVRGKVAGTTQEDQPAAGLPSPLAPAPLMPLDDDDSPKTYWFRREDAKAKPPRRRQTLAD